MMSKLSGENLRVTYAVLRELAQLYSEHAAASKPGHIDVEGRFKFEMKDTPDGGQQLQP